MSETPEPDEKLADRARRGSRDAFAALVARYASRVFSLCFRMSGHRDDADDLTQDVFLKAYEFLDHYEAGRPFAPWLWTIAANACRNHARSRSRPGDRARGGGCCGDDAEDNAPGGDESVPVGYPAYAPLIAIEDAEALRSAIGALPGLDRLALLLRYEEGLSLEDTSAALGLPRGRVAVRICRAKAKLRGEIERRSGSSKNGKRREAAEIREGLRRDDINELR